jgi:hypothetical protein
MSACCNHCNEGSPNQNVAYRRVLWAVLAINTAMFLVESEPVWLPDLPRYRPMHSIF